MVEVLVQFPKNIFCCKGLLEILKWIYSSLGMNFHHSLPIPKFWRLFIWIPFPFPNFGNVFFIPFPLLKLEYPFPSLFPFPISLSLPFPVPELLNVPQAYLEHICSYLVKDCNLYWVMLLQNGKGTCKDISQAFKILLMPLNCSITYTSNVVLSHRSLRSTPNIPDGSAPNLRKGKRTGEEVRKYLAAIYQSPCRDRLCLTQALKL